MVFEEFEALTEDADDPAFRKYMGDGAKAKIRALYDVLKTVSDACDAQVSVEEFNVLVKDKKKIHAIYTVVNSWWKTGGGATDGFVAAFKEMQKYLELPPMVEVKWPQCMIRNAFEA